MDGLSGVTWRRRGDRDLAPAQARKLLAREDVLVMHVYDGEVHPHVGADRAELISEVEQVWSGRDPEEMRTFDLGEFRDASHRRLIVIVEHC